MSDRLGVFMCVYALTVSVTLGLHVAVSCCESWDNDALSVD